MADYGRGTAFGRLHCRQRHPVSRNKGREMMSLDLDDTERAALL